MVNPGFSQWIARKYKPSEQKHRRFPPLVFLRMTFPHAFRLHRVTTVHIHNAGTGHFSPHLTHLSQNLFFNINFVARIARKSQTLFKNLLKMVETILPPLNENTEGPGNTNPPGSTAFTFFSAAASPGADASRNRPPAIPSPSFGQPGEKSPMTVIPQFPPPRFTPSSPVNPAASYRSYEYQTAPPDPHNREKTLPENETVPDVHNVHTLRNVLNVHDAHNARNVRSDYPSVAVFKPLPSIANTAPASVSNRSNTAPLLFTRFMNQAPIPGQGDNSHAESPEHPKKGTSSKPPPALEYSNAFRTALENVKNTVSHVEKKVEEEIIEIKKTHTGKRADSFNGVNRTGTPAETEADVRRLTDRVYRMLEKKIRIEKERRGW